MPIERVIVLLFMAFIGGLVSGCWLMWWAMMPATRRWKDEADRLQRELFIWQSRD